MNNLPNLISCHPSPFLSPFNPELPSDMRFNSAKVISICGYGALFLASSVANITVLREQG